MNGEFLRLAWRSLSTYRLRSALTIVSITIGVMAVIVMVSLAQSGLATLARGIEAIGGSRFVMLWQDSPKKAALKQANYLDGLTLAVRYVGKDAAAAAGGVPEAPAEPWRQLAGTRAPSSQELARSQAAV